MNALRDLERIHNQMLGFDRTFDRMASLLAKDDIKYPPYNIIRDQTNDNLFTIEVAVAGFKQEELSIEHTKNAVKVRGEKKDEPVRKYVHKGIGYRSFEREFTVADNIVVNGATFVDGILTISLENVVTEEHKSKQIPIYRSEKELLLENQR